MQHSALSPPSPGYLLPVVALACQLVPLAPSPAFAQVAMDEFRVSSGATYTITAAEAFLRVNRWIMEPGSTIQLSADLEEWRLEASDASIAEGVRIFGSGEEGATGGNGAHGRDNVRRRAGANGGAGASGNDGSAGKNVTVFMGVREVLGLTIDVSGGRGGNGGHGGDGGRGGRAACPPPNIGGAAMGGNGGAGGDAGHGGNGGSVTLRYSPLAEAGDIVPPIVVSIIGNGGAPGVPGQGGRPGAGGFGRDCPFPIPNQPAGPAGRWGTSGASGNPGLPGYTVTFLSSDASTRRP